jgi:hypothetical protein
VATGIPVATPFAFPVDGTQAPEWRQIDSRGTVGDQFRAIQRHAQKWRGAIDPSA